MLLELKSTNRAETVIPFVGKCVVIYQCPKIAADKSIVDIRQDRHAQLFANLAEDAQTLFEPGPAEAAGRAAGAAVRQPRVQGDERQDRPGGRGRLRARDPGDADLDGTVACRGCLGVVTGEQMAVFLARLVRLIAELVDQR